MPAHLNWSKLKSQFKREENELNQINATSTNAKLSEKTETLIFKCWAIFSDSPTENWVVEMVKMRKQDGDEEKKWELIPQHILETRICTLLPLQSVFSLSGVSKQWYRQVHIWAVLRPFLIRRRSNQLFNYCLLKKVLPLPQGVETLEDENGSRAYAVSVVNFPFHLAVAKQSAERSVWNIKIFKLLTDDVSPCWENVL